MVFLSKTSCCKRSEDSRGEKGRANRHALSYFDYRDSRLCVSGTIRIRWIIVASIFVLVGEFEIRFGEGEVSEESVVWCHGDFMLRCLQRVRRDGRMEYVHFIAAGYNAVNADAAMRIRDRVVRSIQGDHHCA